MWYNGRRKGDKTVKNTAFTDILLNWERLSNLQKIQRLQDLENMISRFQGRKPRTVTTKVDKELLDVIGNGRKPEACYNRNGGKIYFFDLNMSGIDAIKNVIHEGFHAYVDDFISGAVPTLKTYSVVDRQKFLKEEQHLDAIRTRFALGDEENPPERGGYMPLFDSFYVEENLNYQEDSIYIAKNIIDLIESVPDAIKLQQAFIFSLAFDVDNNLRGKDYERAYKVKYDNIVQEAIEGGYGDEEHDVSKCGKIIDNIEPEFLNFYKKMSACYREFVLAEKSPIMTKPMKEQKISQILNTMLFGYRDYVMAMLKAKKKG